MVRSELAILAEEGQAGALHSEHSDEGLERPHDLFVDPIGWQVLEPHREVGEELLEAQLLLERLEAPDLVDFVLGRGSCLAAVVPDQRRHWCRALFYLLHRTLPRTRDASKAARRGHRPEKCRNPGTAQAMAPPRRRRQWRRERTTPSPFGLGSRPRPEWMEWRCALLFRGVRYEGDAALGASSPINGTKVSLEVAPGAA